MAALCRKTPMNDKKKMHQEYQWPADEVSGVKKARKYSNLPTSLA